MPYGRGIGMGRGFRGTYTAWPYIGRGRGGLPRCGHFFANQAYQLPGYTYSNPYLMANNPDLIQNIAANLRDRLAQIKARISDLEGQKTD